MEERNYGKMVGKKAHYLSLQSGDSCINCLEWLQITYFNHNDGILRDALIDRRRLIVRSEGW